MNKKRKCPICDAEVDEDEEFCPECGTYLEEPTIGVEDDLGD